MNLKNLVVSAAVLAGVILTGRVAHAASETGTLTVQANVLASCQIDDATLDFGDYDPMGLHFAAPLQVSTTIGVRCTNGTTYGIGLDEGANGADVNSRAMAGPGGELLPYQLYSDAFGGTVWDNNTATATYTAASNNLFQHTIYGVIAANQVVAEGAYLDTVTATINF